MTTGNPKPVPLKKPEQIKEIPLSWFVGIGRKNQGIIVVNFSKEFQNLGGEEFKIHLEQYAHFMGNRFVGEKLVRNPSEIKDKEARDIVELAEKKIREVTGFNPEELAKKREELAKLYEGKQEAPFSLELF